MKCTNVSDNLCSRDFVVQYSTYLEDCTGYQLIKYPSGIRLGHSRGNVTCADTPISL